MEKVVNLLFVSVVASFLPLLCLEAQEAKPIDIPTLELLIDAHKNKYNKLSDRSLREAAKLGVSETATSLTEEYEKLHKELSSQYTSFTAWGAVGLSALNLAKDIKDSFPLIAAFSRNVKHVANIYILREYIDAITGIRIHCAYLSNTVRKIPLLKANAKEISEVILELQTRVDAITYYLRTCNFMVQGYVALQRDEFKSNPIDKARIATKIIREYSR